MQNDNRIGEECGVFAIYDPDGDCAERPITDFMHFSTEDRKAAVSR